MLMMGGLLASRTAGVPATGEGCDTIAEVASIPEAALFGFDVDGNLLAVYRESVGSIDFYDVRSLPAFDLVGSIDVSDLNGYRSFPIGPPLSLE